MKRSKPSEPMPWAEAWWMLKRIARLHIAVKALV
jgi:hypothetical protein